MYALPLTSRLVHHMGNTAMRRHLEQIEILKYTSAIIFADEEEEGDIMQVCALSIP